MSKGVYTLRNLNFIPNPNQGYKYILFNCKFTDTYNNKTITLYNNAIEDTEGLVAVTVLIQWLVNYELGSGVQLYIQYNNNETFIDIKYIDKDTKEIKRKFIQEKNLPLFTRQAIAQINKSLTQYYNDYYADLNNTGH